MNDEAPKSHEPVLVEEVLALLALKPADRVVDACAGFDGHGAGFREFLGPEGFYLGLDWDREAIESPKKKKESGEPKTAWVQSNFVRMRDILEDFEILEVDVVFFDLGLSSPMLDRPGRGMALRHPEAPLDFRMSEETEETAAQYLARVPEKELTQVLSELGGERRARRVARAIIRRRQQGGLVTVGDFVQTVHRALRTSRIGGIDSATRSAQAVRMRINHELENLREGLSVGLEFLAPGGRLAAISYHSGEDREVKEFFLKNSGRCRCTGPAPACTCGAIDRGAVLTRKPVRPSESEIARNRRARSARLRGFKKHGGNTDQATWPNR